MSSGIDLRRRRNIFVAETCCTSAPRRYAITTCRNAAACIVAAMQAHCVQCVLPRHA
jgi:hypothetical protein